MGFPGGSVVKNPPTNVGDAGLTPGSRRSPEEGNGNPLQYSCLGNPMNRSLACYSPWDCKSIRHDLVTKKQQQKRFESQKTKTSDRNSYVNLKLMQAELKILETF